MRIAKYFLYLIVTVSVSAVLFSACSKKNSAPDYNSNKTSLGKLVDSLTQVYSAAVEGSNPETTPSARRRSSKTALDLAAQVKTGKYTQEEVNNTYNSLLLVGQQFNSQLIQEVSVAKSCRPVEI